MPESILSDPSGNGQGTVLSDHPRGPSEDRPAPMNRVAGHAEPFGGQSPSPAADTPPNPFDPAALRLSQDFASEHRGQESADHRSMPQAQPA